ncbi:hypothetical protein ACSBR2_042689 [Camellia fascicularis]
MTHPPSCSHWQRVIDEIFDGKALVPFAHGMALISYGMFEEVVISCKGNYYEPPNNNCQTALNKVYMANDGLNIYDILEPCYHGPTTKEDTNVIEIRCWIVFTISCY